MRDATSGGAGQGIGAVREVPGAAELVARLSAEYEAARKGLAGVATKAGMQHGAAS
jgi:hypothetical protein